MKPRVEVLKDSFKDYAGNIHHFVIAAVSENFEDSYGDILTVSLFEEHDRFLPINYVTKGVRLGISICHPDDEFNEKIGTLKAINRAQKSSIALFTPNSGYINTTLVKAFLVQEANYLKNNPDKYIKGYNEAKDRYLRNKSMEKMRDEFSEVERIIVEKVQENPRFLDNVNTYLSYIKNKCKKS